MLYIKELFTASKWFYRSLLKGDWLWLMLAVALASLTVTTVDLLANTVKQSMLREAANQLGADLVIKSTRPIETKWHQTAKDLKLKTAQAQTLVTMASSQDNFQLVQLKGISDQYPLRGATPEHQSLWANNQTSIAPIAIISEKLLPPLHLTLGQEVTLGVQQFKLTHLLAEQGVASGFSAFAQPIWVPLDWLEKTQLIGPGSRISYELAVTGNSESIQKFAKLLAKADSPYLQIITAQAPTRDLAQSFDTAWLFLDLAALSAILVAGLSILIASRFYLHRWQNAIALMRALGANTPKIARLFGLQLTWLALLASAIGVSVGYLGFQLLLPFLADFFDPIVMPDPMPTLVKGVLVGFFVLWSFSWQSFQKALSSSSMRLFRTAHQSPNMWHWLISLVLVLVLVWLMTNSSQVHWILLGLLVATFALYLTALALIKLIQAWQKGAKGWFKLSLAALSREPGLVKIQLISIGLVLFVLMLMTFVRQDLMQSWQASLPSNTPDTFVLNIQPEQKTRVDQLLAQSNIATELKAMAKGRLIQLNDKDLIPSEQASNRGRRLLEREANIGIMAELPPYNEIVARLAPAKTDKRLPKVSVEKSIADLFGIQLGDKLTFNFSGKVEHYQVASFRQVQWQSFRLNFFFILQENPQDIDLPLSYIGSFKSPNANVKLTQSLTQDTPGVLLIDAKNILNQVQTLMAQASWAVSALTLFTLIASTIVLFTATQASQQARVQSWLLLKTLGASQNTIMKTGLMEFILLGGIAGALAASLAQISSWSISLLLLKVPPTFSFSLWVTSVGLGIFMVLLIGWITQRHFIKQSTKSLNKYLTEI